jgi:hypothetical protein
MPDIFILSETTSLETQVAPMTFSNHYFLNREFVIFPLMAHISGK